MKKKFLFFLLLIISNLLVAQSPPVVLTFTAQKENLDWICLDSVIIRNIENEWEETIIYPDTLLIFNNIANSIHEQYFNSQEDIQVSPNPFMGATNLRIKSRNNEPVLLQLYDLSGNLLTTWQGKIEAGVHDFKIGANIQQLLILRCFVGNQTTTFKLSNLSSQKWNNKIEYISSSSYSQGTSTIFNYKGATSQLFTPGEFYRYTGYCVQNREIYSQIIEQPQFGSETIIFTFPAPPDKSCEGIPTVTDFEGNVYHTVQIGKQCWLRENLKSTCYWDGDSLPLNDTIHDHDIPFYFKYQQSDSLSQIYGMLYTWAATMRGNVSYPDSVLVQGICPVGWHVPSDAEWCEMEHVVAPQSYCTDPVSFYGISDALAQQLCAPRFWEYDNFTHPTMPGYWQIDSMNCNSTAFSILPAGYYEHGAFFGINWGTCFWTSTEYDIDNAYRRYIQYNNAGVSRLKKEKCHGFSVRCLKDDYDG